MAEIRNVNETMSLEIRTQMSFFKVLNHMARNINSKLAQTHLNSNLLQK